VIELGVRNAGDMRALGEAVGSMLEGGDVVSLTGDLGAGKTTFVQGAARGLGVDDAHVVSPTFTLVRHYRGRVRIYHLDVYRLDRVQEVIDIGFEEYLDPDGVAFVEWGDAIEGLLPESYLEVELWTRVEDEGRLVFVSASGDRWNSRWERLEAVTQPWADATPRGVEGADGTRGP
jgi:tRNA threonylcarbamoyladenosine biosynthesis protein TsaE